MARVDVNRQAIHAAYRRDVVPDWQQATGERMEAAIGASMPVLTGFMRTSSSAEPITHPNGDPGVRHRSRADYTVYVDQGTGIFGKYKALIKPTTEKALSWIGSTGRVFARSTRGQPGQHFYARGLRSIFDRVEEHPR